MTTFAYVRVSTGRQADEGESLGVQERMISGYANMKLLDAPVLFVEAGVSGSIPFGQRPKGRDLLATIKPGDVLIVPAIDRAFRSALDALDVLGRFKEQGIQLHVVALGGDVTADGHSKLVFSILAAVAEGERDRIRERVRDVKRDQAARGRFLGGSVPFGYRVVSDDKGGALIVEDGEQAALARARDLRGQGASLRAISIALKAQGFDVSHNTLGKVLRAA